MLAEVAVVEAEKVPAGHATHTPEALAHQPAGHVAAHAAAPTAALLEPAQAVQPELPVPAAKEPEAHGVHSVLPAAAAKVPAGHCVHVVTRPEAVTGAAKKEPGGQGAQEVTPGFGKEPGAQ